MSASFDGNFKESINETHQTHMSTPSPPLSSCLTITKNTQPINVTEKNGQQKIARKDGNYGLCEPTRVEINLNTTVSRVGPQDHSFSGHHVSHSHCANKLNRVKSLEICRVCGDGPARMHYGVPTCFGCKGFFRRTLKRPKEYTCRYNGNCVVDRYERNSCRFCRFKRCLEVGMDPKAVRPDRDAASRSHSIRHRRPRTSFGDICGDATSISNDVDGIDIDSSEIGGCTTRSTDEWVRKLPVDMRTLLFQIMNIELLVANGDTNESGKNLYPLPFGSLREILQDPTLLDGKRTEMRYETYRRVHSDEFVAIAHRRLIAAIDTVDHLCGLMDIHDIEDKLAMVKANYAALTIFCAMAATARATRDRNILCLCSYGYVPRGFDRIFNENGYEESYYFANRLVDRTLDELVEPFRAFNFKEQEIVLMKTIVVLNPHLRSLSTEAAEQIADLRDRIQETLYNVVRESHPKEVASSRFGNLLLFLPNIMMLGNVMYENLQFIQSFGKQNIDPLLSELLDNIEPLDGHIGYDTNCDESHSLASYNSTQNINDASFYVTPIPINASNISDGFNYNNGISLMRHSTSALSMSSTGTTSSADTSMTKASIADSSHECIYRNLIAMDSGHRINSSFSYDSVEMSNGFSASTNELHILHHKTNGNTSSNDSLHELNNVVTQQQHQQQLIQLSEAESDPDYNMTLTAGNLTGGMRSTIISMDVDNADSYQNVTSDYSSDSNCHDNCRPNFYIGTSSSTISMPSFIAESHPQIQQHSDHCCTTTAPSEQNCCKNSFDLSPLNSQQNIVCGAPHTTVGKRHIFTIEPARDYNPHHNHHQQQPQQQEAYVIYSQNPVQQQQSLKRQQIFNEKFYLQQNIETKQCHCDDLSFQNHNQIQPLQQFYQQSSETMISKSQSYPYMSVMAPAAQNTFESQQQAQQQLLSSQFHAGEEVLNLV